MTDRADKQFLKYWENPEAIRERNRAYYFKKRGLEVPEKRDYKVHTDDAEREKMYAQLKEIRKKINQRTKELNLKEKELNEREERLKKIEESYTLKSYAPDYVKKYEQAKKNKAAKATQETITASTPKFTISKDDFK